MKKIVMCLLAISMVLSLCSCGKKVVEVELGEIYTVQIEDTEFEMMWIGIYRGGPDELREDIHTAVLSSRIRVKNIGYYEQYIFIKASVLIDNEYNYSLNCESCMHSNDGFSIVPRSYEEASLHEHSVPTELLHGTHTYIFTYEVGDTIFKYTCQNLEEGILFYENYSAVNGDL